MRLPRRLARFNRVVTNPLQRMFAWLVPPWAVVIHRGRRSGRAYRTPVIALRSGERIVIAILYGEESDWVRNLLAAGGGELQRAGRRYRLLAPRVIAGDEIHPAVLRVAGRALVADLGERPPRR